MIKSITAAQKNSISINIYTNKYYPGAPREQAAVQHHNIFVSPFFFILSTPLARWGERRTVSCGQQPSWLEEKSYQFGSRCRADLDEVCAGVWIFTKGKNNSKHLVLVLVFAGLTPHTYGEALITMTAFLHTSANTQLDWSHHSQDLSLSFPSTTQ